MEQTTLNYDICIIGGGIIGASIARELSQYNKKIIVLEANHRVAMETSTGNSGVVHGGFDPTPGKLNAKLNVLGKKRYEDWIRDLEFPYLRINSTVIAFSKDELPELQKLYDQGITNGLDPKEMEIIDQAELLKREPNVSKEALGAFVCNSSIAIDPVELTKTLMANAIKNGVLLKVNAKVNAIQKTNDMFTIKTEQGLTVNAKAIINVAGHYADEIAKLANYPDFTTTTRRGQYRILEKDQTKLVNSILFMIPTIHGKGVIVAPTLDGHLMVGPTAENGVPKSDTRLITAEQWDEIGQIGLKIVPTLNMDRTVQSYSGSRPIYEKTDDFYIQAAKNDKNFINVAGIKSPGIASAPAIADLVIELLTPAFADLQKRTDWDPKQKSLFTEE